MAISATASVNNHAAVAQSFELIRSFPNGNDRLHSASTALNPMVLAVRHSSTPAKGAALAYDRRTVSYTNIFYDSEEREVKVMCSMSLILPRHIGVTALISNDANAYVRNFWSANLADLTAGKS